MKRSSLDEREPVPELPPELWDLIISSCVTPVDTITLASVFMLNKAINRHLTENSKRVAKRLLVSKLNHLVVDADADEYYADPFYCCQKCRRIQFGTPSPITSLRFWQGTYCHRCVKKCAGCREHYMKTCALGRIRHRDCVGYSPHQSDDDCDEVEEVYEQGEVPIHNDAK